MFAVENSHAQAPSLVHWLTFGQLSDSLANNPKKVLIYFYADWCVECSKMNHTTFRDSAVVAELNNDFYAVKMNAETTDTVFFGGKSYTNHRAKKMNPLHDIALLMASRKDAAFSLPVVVVLDEDFKAKVRNFQYTSATELMKMLISSFVKE